MRNQQLLLDYNTQKRVLEYRVDETEKLKNTIWMAWKRMGRLAFHRLTLSHCAHHCKPGKLLFHENR